MPGLFLRYTSLGGPKVLWRGEAARAGREAGLRLADLHVSFTHDGDSHLCVVAGRPGLRGLGVDLVHLPRLRAPHKDRRYLLRFARGFMSPEELESFTAESINESLDSMVIRVAAHFSLMEAASKALGTGLKMGAGMGRVTSLPKRSLNVTRLAPEVEFHLATEATARCAALKASRLEGHWSADSEYLVSVVLLWC